MGYNFSNIKYNKTILDFMNMNLIDLFAFGGFAITELIGTEKQL